MVHAAETSLQKLLEGTKQYQVPLYQRTYGWRKQQLTQLWNDIVELADTRSDHPGASHFIGSLVLAPSASIAPTGVQKFLVVDGQQRLTTLTLLLCALRDHRAETEDPSHRERINEKYLLNKWEEGVPPKLLPTQVDRDSYLACLHHTAHAGSDDTVGDTYRFFRSRIANFDDPEDPHDVARVEDAVISGLSLVSVTTHADDNAHRIFESLNNTGLRLTQGDLLRNYLFMRLPTLGDEVYRTIWLPLQDELSTEELELLFWLDVVQRDAATKRADTYSAQQKRLDRLTTEEEIAEDIGRIASLGSLLKLMIDPSTEIDDLVRLRLERQRAWNTTTAFPLILHILSERDRGAIDSEMAASALLVLESYLVRRLVIGRATAGLNRTLLASVQALDPNEPIDQSLRSFLSSGRRWFASDDEVRTTARTTAFYYSGKANQKKLVLQWIAELEADKEPVDPTGLTIEHVLPQTITPEWRAMLGEDLEAEEDIDAVHQSLVHTIGNMTLTGYNSELSNRPYPEKRSLLASSSWRTNRTIAESDRWGRREIVARSDAMAEAIVSYWPSPTESADRSESSVWSRLNEVLAAVPAGSWTTYGAVAAVVGTAAVPLGNRLASHPAINAHRVLQASGRVSPGFRWNEPDRTDDPVELLKAEGVRFDEDGRADRTQEIAAAQLAELALLEVDLSAPVESVTEKEAERYLRFLDQLEEAQPVSIVQGVRALFAAWTGLGGWLEFGRGESTSCFLMMRATASGVADVWPLKLWPSGRVVVPFVHLAKRAPFDSESQRAALMDSLNLCRGVSIERSSLDGNGRFDLAALANDVDAAIDALTAFAEIAEPGEPPSGKVDERASSPATEFRMASMRSYWKAFLPLLGERTDLFDQLEARPGPYMDVAVGPCFVQAWVRSSDARLQIRIDSGDAQQNQQVFEQLLAQRAEIEAAFGNAMNWDRAEDNRACFVRVEVLDASGWKTPESEGLPGLEVLALTMDKFHRAFEAPLSQLV